MHAMLEGIHHRFTEGFVVVLVLIVAVMTAGCARLPYTTTVVHEDPRLAVKLQREIKPAGYTQPVQLSKPELRALLKGFSLREQKSLPLRWFAEEVPPTPVFREDELDVLTTQLADAFAKASPNERVYFELYAPGKNPRDERDVTAGWTAVREPYFYLSILYFHVQQPIHTQDTYYPYYTTTRPTPKSYLLYFEPARYWILDETFGGRGVDLRGFLKSGEASSGR
ncbi:MAG TPA: hypothetical protein VJ692_08390 [Nitrospiraceae bacterium]|nr:hypothetical protein [Nitrospiraceae bacterium]